MAQWCTKAQPQTHREQQRHGAGRGRDAHRAAAEVGDGQHQPEDASADEQRADDVGPAPWPASDEGRNLQASNVKAEPIGTLTQEHAPPGPLGQDDAAGDGADERAQREDAGEQAEGAMAVARRRRP